MNKIYKRILFSALFPNFFIPFTAFSEEEVQSDNETIKFSKRDCRKAVKWVNSELSLLMGSGILKRIVAKKNKYDVYVGEGWYELEFEKRGDILKHFSRSREVMGHPPFLKIFDHDSGKKVASVSKKKIEIQFRDEGTFQYLPHGEKPEHTLY